MTVFASSTSTTVLVRTSFLSQNRRTFAPRNSEPIWSEFRGLLCIGTSTVVGAPNCLKRNL